MESRESLLQVGMRNHQAVGLGLGSSSWRFVDQVLSVPLLCWFEDKGRRRVSFRKSAFSILIWRMGPTFDVQLPHERCRGLGYTFHSRDHSWSRESSEACWQESTQCFQEVLSVYYTTISDELRSREMCTHWTKGGNHATKANVSLLSPYVSFPPGVSLEFFL